MSRVFAIILSQCVLTGSAEQSTNTFLVAWQTHSSLFAWSASPCRQFCFGFYRQLRFHQFIYVWVLVLLNMFHSDVSFISSLSIPSVLPQTQQSDHGPPPKRVCSIFLVCKINLNFHLFVGTDLCLFEPVRVPPTSHLNWNEDIPSHPNNRIKTP